MEADASYARKFTSSNTERLMTSQQCSFPPPDTLPPIQLVAKLFRSVRLNFCNYCLVTTIVLIGESIANRENVMNKFVVVDDHPDSLSMYYQFPPCRNGLFPILIMTFGTFHQFVRPERAMLILFQQPVIGVPFLQHRLQCCLDFITLLSQRFSHGPSYFLLQRFHMQSRIMRFSNLNHILVAHVLCVLDHSSITFPRCRFGRDIVTLRLSWSWCCA